MEGVKDRFLRYVKIDTQSDPNSSDYPSTRKQTDFLRMLKDELIEIGLSDVSMDEYGYVMATIPATTSKKVHVIGFIAHVDTSPDMSGNSVSPQVIEKYDGSNIILNRQSNIVMMTEEFPELLGYVGDTIITTDGTTLLGADDKAGVAEIVAAAQYLISHPEIEHGKIRVAFTADEEIGRGVDYFNVERFGADYAYTMDGSAQGELEYETFNAASVSINIAGRNVHPGYAKGKMINALQVAMEINDKLPEYERPEYTQQYRGFYHLTSINGSVDSATMEYIIRDHDRENFERRKSHISDIVKSVNDRYGKNIISLSIKDQYYNMGDIIRKHMITVDKAKEAMLNIGVVPIIKPVRGGTDGSRLSFMGLPCPNLFAGGENFHGRYEFISVNVMEKATNLIVELSQVWARQEIVIADEK